MGPLMTHRRNSLCLRKVIAASVCLCFPASVLGEMPHAAEAPARPVDSNLAVPSFEELGSPPPLANRFNEVQTNAAVALGNLSALSRMHKASRLVPLYDSMIETEQARLAIRAVMNRRRVQMAGFQSRQRAERPITVSPFTESELSGTVKLMRRKKLQLQAPAISVSRPFQPLVVSNLPIPEPASRSESPTTKITIIAPAAIQEKSDEPAPIMDEPAPIMDEPAPVADEPAPVADADESGVPDEGDLESVVIEQIAGNASPIKRSLTDSRVAAGAASPAAVNEPNRHARPVVVELPNQLVQQPEARVAMQPPVGAMQPPVGKSALDFVKGFLPTTESTTEPDAFVAAEAVLATDADVMSERRTSEQASAPISQEASQFASQIPPPAAPTNNNVSLSVDDVDVRTVLEMLSKSYGLNILVAPDVEGRLTANVHGLTPEQTLQSVLRMCGLATQFEDNVILVYPKDNLPREARRLQMFPLDFARAEVVEPTVQGLLSSLGSSYTTTVDALDNRQGRESIVVIDTPEVLQQVEQYLMQADQPPRQVMIEARILEVELKDDMQHGVNFQNLMSSDVRTGGFRITDSIASSTNPFFFAELSGSQLNALITLLETTTDAKTLATPRVMAINGQNATIQVGQKLGFAIATVTQTATIQDVKYLDTGVVLDVTPTISRDGRVLMSVKPKVSSGAINPDTLLPEETTRQIETSVMLDNHQGMIIGGLIQEDDRVTIRKLPWLGDVKYVGKLFQRRETERRRSEIIVALIPHIVDAECHGYPACEDPLKSQTEWERVQTPLLHGPLNRQCRPWEARLPDVTTESKIYRDTQRQKNADPYERGCEPIKQSLLGD